MNDFNKSALAQYRELQKDIAAQRDAPDEEAPDYGSTFNVSDFPIREQQGYWEAPARESFEDKLRREIDYKTSKSAYAKWASEQVNTSIADEVVATDELQNVASDYQEDREQSAAEQQEFQDKLKTGEAFQGNLERPEEAREWDLKRRKYGGALDQSENIPVEEGRYDIEGLPKSTQRRLRGRVGKQVEFGADEEFLKLAGLPNGQGGPLEEYTGQDEAQRLQQTGWLMNEADTPDQVAKDQELAEKEGVPAFVVAQDRKRFSINDVQRRMDDAFNGAPKLQEQMADRDFFNVAYDSVEQLSAMEKFLKKTGRLGLSTTAGAMTFGASGLRGQGEVYRLEDEEVERRPKDAFSNPMGAFGWWLKEYAGLEIDKIPASETEEYIAPKDSFQTFKGALGESMVSVGDVASSAVDAVRPEDQSVDEQLAEALGQIAGAVTLAGVTKKPQAAVPFFAGMGADQQASRMREMGIDPNEMPTQVLGGAAVTIGLEQLRLGSIFKMVPQSARAKAMNSTVTKFLEKVTPKGLKKAADSAVGQGVRRITGQALEEGTQEAVENMAQNAIAMTYDENAELLEGAAEGAAIGGSASAIFQSLVEIILPGKQRMTVARETAEVMKQVREEVESAPVTERRREGVKNFLDDVSDDQEVYINPEDFLTLYQDNAEAAYEIFEEMGVDREALDEAIVSGSDITVKGSALLTLKDSKQFNVLVDVMRSDPDAMSVYETQQALLNDQFSFDHDLMREIYDEGDKEQDTYTRVSEAVEAMAIAANERPEVAAMGGSIWGARFKRLEDDGIKGDDAWERLGLQIRQVDEQGQPLQKTIRDYWTGPKPKEPQSLNKWIASQGGISEAGMGRGDVMQAIGQKKSDARGVFNENGTSLDMMARQAAEAGYDVDPEDVQSLLDAISNDAQGGTPLYRTGEADEWNAYQEALDQVEEASTDRRGEVNRLAQNQEQFERLNQLLDLLGSNSKSFFKNIFTSTKKGAHSDGEKIATDFSMGQMTVNSKYGEISGYEKNGAFIIRTSYVAPEFQGNGYGVDLYQSFVDEAFSRGKVVFSDRNVTKQAGRAWFGLAHRGYKVYENYMPEQADTGEGRGNVGQGGASPYGDSPFFVVPKDKDWNFAEADQLRWDKKITRKYSDSSTDISNRHIANEGYRKIHVGERAFFQAIGEGYEGNDIGEATEWTEAIAKGLDMSQEARMQRAKDMGFDVDTVLYHATRADFKEFKGDIGPYKDVFWFAGSDIAGRFTGSRNFNMDGNPSIIPVYLKNENPFLYDPESFEGDRTLVSILKTAKDGGHDGIEFKKSSTAISFSPSNIRSVNAAFDPDYADSPNILRQSIGDIDFTTPQARKEWVDENTISEHIGGKGKTAKRYGFQVTGTRERVVLQLDPQWEEGAQVLTINSADLERGRVGENVDLDADGLEGLAENLSAILSQNLEFPVTVEVNNKAEQDFYFEIFKQVAEDNGGRATKAKGLGVYYSGPNKGRIVTKADASPVGEKSVEAETEFFNKLNEFTSAGYGRTEVNAGLEEGLAEGRAVQTQKERAEREAQLRSERSSPFPQTDYFQKDGKQARGFVEIPKGGVLSNPAVVVSLTKSKDLEKASDASTFIHETAHIFLELEMSLESESPAIKARMDAVREWLGMDEGSLPTVAQHEKFAESFEAYLLEGKAPNAELRGVFRRFRTWLIDIYQELNGKKRLRKLDPKAKAIFDGMLATQVEIEQAQRDFMGPLASAMRDVMTPEQIEKYKKYALEAGELAKDKLFAKYLDGIKKREGRERRQQRKDLTADVTEKLLEMPVFKAQHAMKGALGRKMNMSDVAEMRGDDNAAKTKDYHVEGGEHPELVAPDYGFLSGDEMLQALEEAPTLKTAVKSEVDRMMKELHGDMLTDGTMEAEAVEAVFNDKAVKAMEVERNAMAEKAAGDPIPLNDIKAYAEYIITKKPIKEILTPAKYAMQGRNLHKKAVMLAAKGKWDEALNTAHKAMLQHELARRAYKAREEFEKHDRFLKRFSPRKMGKDAHKKFAPEYVEQINRYYALPGAANQQDEFAILNEFALQQLDAGNDVVLNTSILNGEPLPEIRDMTMEQLRDYRDGMQNLNHLGRKTNEASRAAFREETEELAADINDAWGDRKRIIEERNPNLKSKLMAKVRDFDSSILRWNFIVEAFQGGLNGRLITALDTGIRRQLTARNSRRMNMQKEFAGILKKYGITQSEMGKKLKIPMMSRTGSTRFEELIAVAMNMGTEQNRDRLTTDPTIDGEVPEIMAMLEQHLEERHWLAVQETWDLIGTLWPEASAVHRDATGVTPKKVSASSFDTPYGKFSGGYYPIKYDLKHKKNKDIAEKEIKDIWEQQTAGVSVTAQTNQGFLKERQANSTRPLRLDLTVVLSHIDDVTNDIYMRKEVSRVWKILRSNAFSSAVSETHGEEYLKAMETIIQRVVAGPVQPKKTYEKILRTARVNASVGILGLNLVSAGLAPTSYLQTVGPRYGRKIIIRGMSEYYGQGIGGVTRANKFIKEKSSFMRERVDTLNREAHDMIKRNKLDSKYGQFQGAGFLPMAYAELYSVSGATWMGVYHTRIEEGYTEQDAITEADKAVATTQGSGLEIDQSVMQSGHELEKWMTFMYGYVSGVYGIVRNDTASREAALKKLIPLVKHLVIFNVMASTVEAMIRSGWDEDDEDPFLQTVMDLMVRNTIGLVPGVSGLLSKYSNETSLDGVADNVKKATEKYYAVSQEFYENGYVEGQTVKDALVLTGKAVGMGAGVPGTAQAMKIIKTLEADEAEDDPIEETIYKALITGPD